LRNRLGGLVIVAQHGMGGGEGRGNAARSSMAGNWVPDVQDELQVGHGLFGPAAGPAAGQG